MTDPKNKPDVAAYVYILSESGPDYRLYTVGFYNPNGEWVPESDWNDLDRAAKRVHYLNGGSE